MFVLDFLIASILPQNKFFFQAISTGYIIQGYRLMRTLAGLAMRRESKNRMIVRVGVIIVVVILSFLARVAIVLASHFSDSVSCNC